MQMAKQTSKQVVSSVQQICCARFEGHVYALAIVRSVYTFVYCCRGRVIILLLCEYCIFFGKCCRINFATHMNFVTSRVLIMAARVFIYCTRRTE